MSDQESNYDEGSNTKCECKKMAERIKDIVSLSWFIKKLGLFRQKLMKLLCENQGNTKLVHNPMFHVLMKYVKLHYHLLQKKCYVHIGENRLHSNSRTTCRYLDKGGW